MDGSKTRSYLPDLLSRILDHLGVVHGPDSRGEYITWCPYHDDDKGLPTDNPNLHISEKGYKCFRCGSGGSLSELARELGILKSSQRPESVYDYCDEHGNILFHVYRLPNKRFRQVRPDGQGGIIWNIKGTRRVLYNLPALSARQDDTVYVVEGEKDANRLISLGLLATCNPGGAGKWQGEYSDCLTGRDIVIIPDNDDAGDDHASLVAHSLYGRASRVRIVKIPDLPVKGDVSDWLQAGHTLDELSELSEQAPDFVASGKGSPDYSIQEDDDKPKQADLMVSMLDAEGVIRFHDQHGIPHARIPVDTHHEIHRCDSRRFKAWLALTFKRTYGKTPGSEVIRSALNVIEAEAIFHGDEYELFNRVARVDDAIWYDLADDEWRAVKITADGWEIVADTPILFRRYRHQQAQVVPSQHRADLRQLFDLVNVWSKTDQVLVLATLVGGLIPDIPHPVLVVHGPHGSAKTSALRYLKQLIDPSDVPTLSFHRDPKEVIQQLSHHYVSYFDNVSSLPPWMSDMLCRASTGEGFSKRELYSNDEDVIYKYRRCVGMSCINVAPKSPDLLDRSILIELPPISKGGRRSERTLEHLFDQLRPQLVSRIFDTLAETMRRHKSVRLKSSPRMADFAEFGYAIAEATGIPGEDFLAAYQANMMQRNREVLESNPLASALAEFAERKGPWSGTATELIKELNQLATKMGIDKEDKLWPGRPNDLTRRIRLIIPNLGEMGVDVTFPKRVSGERKVQISKVDVSGVPWSYPASTDT